MLHQQKHFPLPTQCQNFFAVLGNCINMILMYFHIFIQLFSKCICKLQNVTNISPDTGLSVSLHPHCFFSFTSFFYFSVVFSFSLPHTHTLMHTHKHTHFQSLFSLSLSCKHLFFHSPVHTLPFAAFSKMANICTWHTQQRNNDRYVCRHACKHGQYSHMHTRTQTHRCGVRSPA